MPFCPPAGHPGQISIGAGHDAGLARQRPAFDFKSASGFQSGHPFIEIGHFAGIES